MDAAIATTSSNSNNTGTASITTSASNTGTGAGLTIYVARHGQDKDNAAGILNGHRDQPLTELGKEQAQTVATKILKHGLTFDAVYASPLQRAFETAQIILKAQTQSTSTLSSSNLEVVQMDDLIERDFGILTGTPIKEIPARVPADDMLVTDTINYFLSPQGAETFPQLKERGKAVLEELYKKHNDSASSTVLLVTHGDFGKMLYAAYYDLDWKVTLQQFHFGNSDLILLSRKSSPKQAHVFQIQQYNA